MIKLHPVGARVGAGVGAEVGVGMGAGVSAGVKDHLYSLCLFSTDPPPHSTFSCCVPLGSF